MTQDFAFVINEISFSLEENEMHKSSLLNEAWAMGKIYTLIADSEPDAVDKVIDLISTRSGHNIYCMSMCQIDPIDAYSTPRLSSGGSRDQEKILST